MGRAIKELELPNSPAIVDVLNGPCPPTVMFSRLPLVAATVDAISLACSSKRELIKIYLPSAAEVLTEVLMENGVEPTEDEKRSAYLPVVKRLGGAVGDRIPFLLLDKQHLELGERRVERDNFRSRLAFYDLLKEPFVDAAIKRVARPEDQRKVEFGVGTLTRGT